VWVQGFETDATGWTPPENVVWTTDPASSSSYGLVTGTPYTDFGGYTNTWPGEWGTTIDVYLDPAWADGKGFNYSVATNDSAGVNLRDFGAMVAKDASTGQLLVLFDTRGPNFILDDLENYDHTVVDTAGWYTIRHTFKDVDGVLNVEVELAPNGGESVYTKTLTGSDQITAVGGNRYGWFTAVDIDGGLQVDNVVKLGVAGSRAGAPTGQVHRRRRHSK